MELKIRTIIEWGEEEFTANSFSFESHIQELGKLERHIEKLSRMSVCLHCGQRFEQDRDETFCSQECAELHTAQTKEAEITGN